jgi:hypothetical protein
LKALIFVFFNIIVLISPQYGQTQLLKVGNAVEFGDIFSAYLEVTVSDVTINGKKYLKRKLGYQPWNGQGSFYNYSYERIEGDSIHYILSSTNTDSLSFNFNWPVGTVSYSSSTSNEIFEKRIDSIYVDSYLIPQDTIYLINWYRINLTTGDTISYGDPFYDKYSRKLGPMHSGLGAQLQGAKVDGVRYGDIMPYPEEIVFSEDSLYSEFIGDTVKCYIKNTSEYDVVLDSIYTFGLFPYGYLLHLIKDNNYFFINLFNNYPSHPLDTLNYIISAHDSILLQIYDIDLCAICKKQPNEYFEDNLRFVFSFLSGNEYSFSKSIPISGEGHPSDVADDSVMPNEFILEQNYPNPFNPSTTIKYSIPNVISTEGRNLFVNLKVYDVLGNEVATLINEEKPAGNYEVGFNVSHLASGIYYYQLKAGSFTETKKMILLR